MARIIGPMVAPSRASRRRRVDVMTGGMIPADRVTDRRTSISTTSSIVQTASWLLIAAGQHVGCCIADRIRRRYPLPRRHTLVPTRLQRLPVRQAMYTITRSTRAPLSSRHRWPISARPTLPCVELRMSSEQELEPADQALHVGDHRAPCTRDL